MKRRLTCAFALLLISVAFAYQVSAQDVDRNRVKAEAMLKAEGANGDGKLSKEEFRKEKLFDLIDSNKDGFVTVQEDVAYRARKSSGSRGSKADKGAVSERHTASVSRFFNLAADASTARSKKFSFAAEVPSPLRRMGRSFPTLGVQPPAISRE